MHRLFSALCLATATKYAIYATMAAKTAAESKPADTQLAGRKAAATLGPQLAGRLPAGPGRQYFYWLCPARTGDKAAPLLMWLNGGPGSSSMMGLFLENGPYWIADDGSLHTRNASWNNKFDVLYVDQPAGTGFSVAQSPDAYARNQDDVAEAFSAFLANFYGAYPDTRTKQLWLTGESYAGKYLPAIAARFVTHGIPVAGVAIGNGLTCPREMTLTVPASYYAVGILDQSQRDRAYRLALDIAAHIDAGRWSNATAARSVLFDYIDDANGPNTAPNVDSILKYGAYDESGISAFLNSAETKQRSLNLPADATWRQESKAVPREFTRGHHETLRISSNQSSPRESPCSCTRASSTSATAWPRRRPGSRTGAGLAGIFLASPRKAWMSPGRAIAGYYRSCGGLTHLTVNAAGHLTDARRALTSI